MGSETMFSLAAWMSSELLGALFPYAPCPVIHQEDWVGLAPSHAMVLF